ncbi:hypothetical protein QOZ80_3BG0283630 [Eleusine coracana subsp. coracana]|nr:hypothetical protein QOZ80_3BG0283630 [Eleusine coracana subsp. coracana]
MSLLSCSPAWVLLDEFAILDKRRNHTTATGLTSFKRPVRVSFELAHPPEASRWFVHCPGLKKKRGLNGHPQILNAAESLVVLRMQFLRGGDVIYDYFVYRAGPGKPSLDLIPGPCPTVAFPKQVGILPRGDLEEYSVIFPRCKPRRVYEIRVFSSENNEWRTKVARISTDPETTYHEVAMHLPSKAIVAGKTLWNNELNKLDLNKLSSAPPTLSLNNENVLYFTAKLETGGALLLAVNTGAGMERLETFIQTSCGLSCAPCSFSRFLDASPDGDISDQLEDINRVSLDSLPFYVLSLLMAREQLLQLVENRPSYLESRALLSTGPVASLYADLQELAQYVTTNNLGQNASEAMATCIRALGAIDDLAGKNDLSGHDEVLMGRVNVALVALEKLLLTLPGNLEDNGRAHACVSLSGGYTHGSGFAKEAQHATSNRRGQAALEDVNCLGTCQYIDPAVQNDLSADVEAMMISKTSVASLGLDKNKFLDATPGIDTTNPLDIHTNRRNAEHLKNHLLAALYELENIGADTSNPLDIHTNRKIMEYTVVHLVAALNGLKNIGEFSSG